MNAPTLPQAAENYARRGWYVFPLKPGDKKPLTDHGVKDASCDVQRIRRWWHDTPTANIGLDCGRSGIVVIDLDVKPDVDGRATWASMGFSTSTTTANTGGGGVHLLFSAPTASGSIGNSQSKLGPGIDVRANGGYIVLPPSRHPSGRLYEWASTGTIEPLPEPLAEKLRAPVLATPLAAGTLEDPWKLLTLKDARAPRAPVVWLVENFIAAGTFTIVYGAPGCLKSLLLADLACCVVGGFPWLTMPDSGGGHKTTPARVLWLDADNGQRATDERLAALADTYKLPDDAGLIYASYPDPPFVANDGAAVAALCARVLANDVRLVIIDNLSAVSGGVEENSSDMQSVMAGLRSIPEKTGAALIVIHHQRKMGSAGNGMRAGESLRGHSSIEAAIDSAVLIMRPDEEAGEIISKTTKTRGAPVSKFSGVFTFESDADKKLTLARFFGQVPRDLKAEAAAAAQSAVLAVLEGGPKNNSQVKALAGVRAALADAALEELRAIGKIKLEVGKRGAKIYSLIA